MKTRLWPLLILTVGLCGCNAGLTEQSLVGKWKGEVKMPESSKDDPMAKMGEAMLGMMAMDLELKADKKFTLMVFIIPLSGDWSLNGNIVTLQPTTVMGLSPEEFAKEQAKDKATSGSNPDEIKKPMRLEVQPDGKSIKALDDIGGQKSEGDFIFTRKS